MPRILTAIFLVYIASFTALAQNQPGFDDKLAPRKFYIDYAAFQGNSPDSVLLEVYYKAYSSLLSYEKWGDKFKASYEIDIILNRKGKQITGITKDGDLIADSYEMTRSRDDFIIDKFSFTLPRKDYEIIGRFIDTNSGSETTAKDEIKLKNFGKKIPYLSNLEFIRESEHSADSTYFDRDGVRLIPSVSRMFGFSEPKMMFYYQIYNDPAFKGDYLVYYDILKDNKTQLSDTSLFPTRGNVTGRLEEIDVDDLMPGIYDLSVRVESPGKNLKIETVTPFSIEWSVLGIVRNDFKTAVEQLRYIASREQLKEIKGAPDNKRMEMWKAFWQSKDPTPGTPENELMDEYYRRVRYADLNFGHFGRDGWKTDMGMVYITYGSPDEIERHPFDINAKPYQIWFYYEQKRRFVFVDFNGYGEYELQYPYDGDITRVR